MTKKIKWRLGQLPTPEELRGLVSDKLISKEEAREILFNEVEEENRDTKSLQSEIAFLRELVENLSKDKTKIIETIRIVEKPYTQYPWYQPYYYWANGNAMYTTTAGGGGGGGYVISGTANSLLSSSATAGYMTAGATGMNFSSASSRAEGRGSFKDIKTF